MKLKVSMLLAWGNFDVSGSDRIHETESVPFPFCFISTDLFTLTL